MRRMIAVVALASLVTFTHVSSAQRHRGTATGPDSLDRPLHLLQPMQDVTTERAFATALFRSSTSGGIIELGTCDGPEVQSRVTHSFSLAGLTLRQALDLIVADDPKYRWNSNQRIVNLVPANGIPDVLKTRISHFEIRPDESVVAVGERLFKTLEVRQVLVQHRLVEQGGPELIIGGAPPKIGHTVALESATVMEILNAAAASNRYPAVWKYTERLGRCQGTYELYWPVGSGVIPLSEHK